MERPAAGPSTCAPAIAILSIQIHTNEASGLYEALAKEATGGATVLLRTEWASRLCLKGIKRIYEHVKREKTLRLVMCHDALNVYSVKMSTLTNQMC